MCNSIVYANENIFDKIDEGVKLNRNLKLTKQLEQPNDGYTPQMYYALVVSNNIQSLGGNTLEQEQLIDFWVEYFSE